MIRFRRLFDLATDADRRRLAEVQAIFVKAFPYEAEVAARIPSMIVERANFETILLIAKDDHRTVRGFTLTLFFPELRYAYLYYIASHPERPARGIGGALYEATRELLSAKGCRGLFLDVPPDDPENVEDRKRLAVNRRRLKFYERYGALPVANTLYDALPNPANAGYHVLLLFDPLGRRGALPRADARKFVQRMFRAQYGLPPDDPYVRRIVDSFKDDPVRLRPARYTPAPAAAPPKAPEPGHWIRPLDIVVAERHRIHHLREKGYVERPVRVDAVLRGLADLPIERHRPRHFGEDRIKAVHDPHLVAYLAAVCSRLAPDALVYPEVFPIRRPERRPKELALRAGYFCIDTFTPLTHNAYAAARAAADCALTAAELLLQGERLAYALCRPPGHHAERSVFGGFCYLNNAAIAAQSLASGGRKVALLDIDHHHGNGSQDIFYRRNDVYTVSIHGHPNNAYPHFSGFADEKGEGDGSGFNRNYPLRPGVEDDRYIEVLDDALAHIRRFRPDWLVLSLGFDIMRGDPTGSFLVTLRGMRRIGEAIGRLGLPTLVVQEGGYSVWNLRRGARSFFLGLAGSLY